MAISLLGPLQVDGAARVSPRDRVVLSVLALHRGEAVPAERLADALWGEQLPDSWAKVVQGSVVRLRKALGGQALQTTSAGYRLVLADDEIDLRRFERLVDRARVLAEQGEHARAALLLQDALGLWRGPALVDVEHWAPGRGALADLDERRQEAEELLVHEELASGHDVVGRARALCTDEPLRERRWALLATALYRSGRQAESLAALRSARTVLLDELGLDPGPELQALEQAVLRHDRSLRGPEASPAAASSTCPYKGLQVFERADADSFFGRDEDVAACLRVLAVSPVLVIVGPSGSGKSSLARAGLVPVLERAGPVPVVVPGSDPLAALVGALLRPPGPTALVVDQLEELFTGNSDRDVAVRVLERLVAVARGGQQVIATLRADAVGGLAAAPSFARLAERGLLLLTAMTEEGLRAAVEGPARRAGLRLESGLVELLLREVEGEPGALPLLSHALAETWERREADLLTVHGYRATGGIRSAVAQSAELLHDSLPPGQHGVLRAILLRLVASSPDGEPAAARVPLAAVTTDADHRAVLDLLVRARLVTTAERTVALAHESLLRSWPRLRSWFDDDVDASRLLRHLSVAADDWQSRGRAGADLYRGPRLEAALAWHDTADPALAPVEREFLDASAALALAERDAERARARQQARQNRRLRAALGATAGGLVLAVAASAVAVQQSGEAGRTARHAQVDRLVAESIALRDTRRDLAALLAVAAHDLRPDAATRGALLGVFTAAPGFVDYRPIGDPPAPVAGARLLPDGRTVLAVGVDGVLRTFDIDDGGVAPFPSDGPAAAGAVLGVSGDGSTAATASWQAGSAGAGRSALRVYDVATQQSRFPETALPFDAGAVAVSGDGRYVAVGGYADGRVLVYDTAGRERLPELSSLGRTDLPAGVLEIGPVPQGAASAGPRATVALAFGPDGRLLVGSAAGLVRAVDVISGRSTEELVGPPLTSNLQLAVGDDGTVIGSGSAGLAAWDAAGRLHWSTPLPQDGCRTLAVHRAADAALCGGGAGEVVALDLGTGRPTGGRYDLHRGPVSGLVVTADGSTLLGFSATEGVSGRWRLDDTGPLTRRVPLPGAAGGYSADGRLLLADGVPDDGRAAAPVVIDAESGAVVARLDGYLAAAWTPHPHRLVGWERGTGHVVDLAAGGRVVQLQGGLGQPPAGAVSAPGPDRDGRLVAWGETGTGSTAVEVWDLASGDIVRAAEVSGLSAASLTLDGRVLLTTAGDRTRSQRVGDGAVLGEARGLWPVEAGSAGVVVAGGVDGRLHLLDPQSLQPSGRQPVEAPGPLVGVAVDAGGQVVASHTTGGAVQLYDLPTGLQLGTTITAPVGAGRVSVRPDGRQLSVPVAGGTLLWDLDPLRWEQAACRLAGRRMTDQEWHAHLAPVNGADRPCRVAAAPAPVGG